MCLIICSAGWFLLVPSEYATLGKHVASSITFLSNIVYWSESGYFDTSSHQKWLLHTWSLSVEWQFYLLYPIAVLFLRRYTGLIWSKRCLVLLGAVSFLLSIFLSNAPGASRWSTLAFYMLPTRAWEMIAGALIFLYPKNHSPRLQAALEYVGIAIVIGSVAGIHSGMVWPGWLAAIPVLGAALILVAGNNHSPITANRPLQFLGTASYSIYLWHWPLVVALNYFQLSREPFWNAGAIALSVGLGYLSYVLVETPVRRIVRNSDRGSVATIQFATIVLVVAAVGVTIATLHGLPSRVGPKVLVADNERMNANKHKTDCNAASDPCDIAKLEKTSKIVIVGDSHAETLSESLLAAMPDGQRGDVLLVSNSGCPTLEGVKRNDLKDTCIESNGKFLEILGRSGKANSPIVLVGNWSGYISGDVAGADHAIISFADRLSARTDIPFSEAEFQKRLSDTVCHLTKVRDVYIVKPVPTYNSNVPTTLARSFMWHGSAPEVVLDLADYRKRNAIALRAIDQASEMCGAHILDPTTYLCPSGKCIGSANGRPLYLDNHHMSEFGNRFLVPMFRPIFASQIN